MLYVSFIAPGIPEEFFSPNDIEEFLALLKVEYLLAEELNLLEEER